MIPQKRIIHTSLWFEDDFIDLNIMERLFYIALINFADDEGCFTARPRFWKRMIFPHNRNVYNAKIEQMMQKYHEIGFINLASSKKGPAGFHPKWWDYQNLKSDRLRQSDFEDILVANSVTPRYQLAAQEKKKKDKLKKEKLSQEKQYAKKGELYVQQRKTSDPEPIKNFVKR